MTRCTSCSLCTRSSAVRAAYSGELLLLHRAQVARADAVAHVGELQRALVLGDRLPQDRLALVQREAGRQRVLHLAERARADAPVLGHRLLLLRRADLDLRLQRAAE